MINIHICKEQKVLQQATPSWISKTLNKNRVMGNPICVKIKINTETANLSLTTQKCGSYQEPNPSNDIERRVVFLWNDQVMSKDDLDGHTIYDFLERVDHWVSFVPK